MKKRKGRTYYLHTIAGKPAMFDGQQICYQNRFGPADPMATSLKQIRKEQKATELFRVLELRQHFDRDEYDYVRIWVGEP